MLRTKGILLLGACLVFASLIGLADGKKNEQTNVGWEGQVEIVKNILSGRNIENVKGMISPGAELVHGAVRDNLYDVVTARGRSFSLLEDSTRKPVSLSLKMNDAEDASFLLLQTGPDKETIIHTVVFMKDSAGQWKIETWHTSK